tara:strand:- start:15167 stop:15685 length:519 start_codon:yes stop_codon:yes gene_type:complete
MTLDVSVGGASSDSYASVVEYNAYAMARGVDVSNSVSQKEAWLRVAAEYIDFMYAWRGTKSDSSQARMFPRNGLIDEDGVEVAYDAIPGRVKNSQMQIALELKSGADLFGANVDGSVQSKTTEVDGAVRETLAYFKGRSKIVKFPLVDNMLMPFYSGKNTGSPSVSVPVVRA